MNDKEKVTPKFRGPWSPQLKDPKQHQFTPKATPPSTSSTHTPSSPSPPPRAPSPPLPEEVEGEPAEPIAEEEEVEVPQSPSASLTKSPSTNAKRKGNIKVNPKYSPLHLAVYDNNFERVMEQLNGDGIRYINEGEDINGFTPILMAAECTDVEFAYQMVMELLKSGADPKIISNTGSSTLIGAATMGNIKLVKMFLEEYHMHIDHTTVAGNTAITNAAEKGHLEMAKYLLSKGADLYKKHGSGRLPLHQAATSGRTEMVGYLLDQGMPVDLELGHFKVAPLALACERGHIDTVVLLLERGANPNKKRTDGAFPLFIAAQKGHLNCIIALKRADVNMWFNKPANTAYGIARVKRFPEIMKELKRREGETTKSNEKCILQ